jgi:putative ABC transport system ATP-binding protein
VGLYHRRHHKLNQLSGGEQQRVAIAVSLANKPVLLLGDEPTGEVDSVTAQAIMNTFRSLRDRLDITIIIVTHDPRIAEQVDRVVAIRDGKISTETIRQVGQLERAMAGKTTDGKASDQKEETLEVVGGDLVTAPGHEGTEKREHITLQEFVVLDSAGRLQIPKELREELGIGKRAQLETGDNCIIIRPVLGQGEEVVKKLTLEEQIAALFTEKPADPPGKKGRGLINRGGRK